MNTKSTSAFLCKSMKKPLATLIAGFIACSVNSSLAAEDDAAPAIVIRDNRVKNIKKHVKNLKEDWRAKRRNSKDDINSSIKEKPRLIAPGAA